jgi:hypothetical protein
MAGRRQIWRARNHAHRGEFADQLFGETTEQCGQRVLAGTDLGLQGRKLRLLVGQFAIRQGDVKFIGNPALKTDMHNALGLLQRLDRRLQRRDMHLCTAQVDVGPRHIGND